MKNVKDRLLKFSIPEPNSGCWLWISDVSNVGYGILKVKGKNKKAHRLSFELFKGPLKSRYDFVCHKCDTRLCINPDHLFVGTLTDNVRDMMRKNRGKYKNKFSDEDIPKIKQMWSDGFSMREIGRKYGVEHHTISRVINDKHWRQA